MSGSGPACAAAGQLDRPAWLYHGSRLSRRLGKLVPSPIAQVCNNRAGRWLFATHRRDHAALFACPPPPAGSFSMTLDSEDGVLVHFRAETVAELGAVDGRIYTLAAAAFEPVASCRREWVSAAPLRPRASNAIKDWKEPMRHGVQIFCLAAADRAIFDAKDARYLFAAAIDRYWLADRLARPAPPLVWLNRLMDVNPDPELEALLNSG